MSDFSLGWLYRARMTELQDIAALDQLAAQAAPPSALRRYAASRRVRARDEHRGARAWRRVFGHRRHLPGATV